MLKAAPRRQMLLGLDYCLYLFGKFYFLVNCWCSVPSIVRTAARDMHPQWRIWSLAAHFGILRIFNFYRHPILPENRSTPAIFSIPTDTWPRNNSTAVCLAPWDGHCVIA